MLRLILDTYRRGLAAIVLVPGFLLVAAIPEFVQHVAEIRMGMFTSVIAAKAIANSAERWGFGYFKLAGLLLALTLVRGSGRPGGRGAPRCWCRRACSSTR